MQTTIAHGYIPPNDEAINKAAEEVGLRIKAPEFIRDVCTMKADGSFMDVDALKVEINGLLRKDPIQIYNKKEKNKNIPVFYHRTVGEFSTQSAATSAYIAKQLTLANKIKHAITSIPDMQIPGSPMYQAVNLLKILAEQQGENAPPKGDGSPGSGGEEDLLQKLLSQHNITQAKNNLNEANNMSQDERDLLNTVAELKRNEDTDEDKPENTGYGGAHSPGTETGMTAKGKSIIQAAVNMSDKVLRDATRISRKLQSISKLKTSKLTKFEPDSQEDEVRNRAMTSYAEIGRIKSQQFTTQQTCPALFKYRACTNQLSIRERGRYTEKKQLLYVIVDCSGSMNTEHRISAAAGVLLNRLMAVANGDATLYWRFFDTVVHECTYVENKEQAYKSISQIVRQENYGGGGTNFDVAIRDAVKHINEVGISGTDFVKPEIFMVTDGECDCTLKFKDLNGIKLHTALVSSVHVPQLTNLSKETGGIVLAI